MIKSIYVIGSLRNPNVTELGHALRELGFDAFEDWMAAGPEADDYWQKYENARGHRFDQALAGYAAQHVFSFDKFHLDRCDAAVLLLPAGKSGHLELGYMIGKGKPGYILMEKEPERFDVMYNFASGVFFDPKGLFRALLIHNGNLVGK
jgi:nucleoside 2-deoxyribosyltransferase